MLNKIKIILFAFILISISQPAIVRPIEINNYDPMSSYKSGMSWNFAPYLLVNIPPAPGDAIYSQGPIPRIAPFISKSGWIPGHAGIFVGKNKNKKDGTETYMAAESCRYGVWYVYFYPLYRFERGHGRVDDFFTKNEYFARMLKFIPGLEIILKAVFKNYDSSLDGTYIGARTLSFLENNPDEYVYRRKIIEYANNCVLQNSHYNYEAFIKPFISIFYSLNTQGTGQTGKGHNERYTCVGLVESSYEYAGIDIIPPYAEESNLGVTPLKQFLYMKPVSRVQLKQGEKTNFDVWHVVNGKKTFEYEVKCSNLPNGCTFKDHNFKIDSSLMTPGTYEVEFISAAFAGQRQKIKIIISQNNIQNNHDMVNEIKSFNQISLISTRIKNELQKINLTAKNTNIAEYDKKLIKLIKNCSSVNEAILIVKSVKSGTMRDIALLYSISLARTPKELYQLTNYTNWSLTTNKILFSPLGYKIEGIDECITRLINSENFMPFYEGNCLIEFQKLLSGNYVFKQTVNIPLKISYNDIITLNETKIMEFIIFLCKNPDELNIIENSYLISLIQKRIYFATANNEPAAGKIKNLILKLNEEYTSALTIQNSSNSSIENPKLIVARFLHSMVKAIDAKSQWLEQSLLIEKNFLIALSMNFHSVPGISPAANELYSSSSDRHFNNLIVSGTLSDNLKDFILKNEGIEIQEHAKKEKNISKFPFNNDNLQYKN